MPRPVCLFLDDCIHAKAAPALRELGFDAINAHDAERLRLTDEQQLEFATNRERALLTFNVIDFKALAAEWAAEGREHAGILLAPESRYKTNLRLLLDEVRHALTDCFPDDSWTYNRVLWIPSTR